MLNMPEQPAPRNFLWTRKKVAIQWWQILGTTELKDRLVYSEKDANKATQSVLELLNPVLKKNIKVKVQKLHKEENEVFYTLRSY